MHPAGCQQGPIRLPLLQLEQHQCLSAKGLQAIKHQWQRSAGGTKAAAAGTKPIAADTAGSQNSSQDKRQQTAQAYLARLQEALPSAAYQQLMKHLQQYRKDHDTLKVTDGVLDLLRLPSRRHLLLDFAKFLRSQDRDWFLRCVK